MASSSILAPATQNISWTQGTNPPLLSDIIVTIVEDSTISLVQYFIQYDQSINWLTTGLPGSSIPTDGFSATLPLTLQNLNLLPIGTHKADIRIDLSSDSEYVNFLEASIFLTVIGTPIDPTDPEIPENSYGEKYWLEYTNLENDTYKLTISEKGYLGESIEINGVVTHAYEGTKDLMQPIVASSLEISLDASENLSFTDLYSEKENAFKVVLTRNSQVIFIGFLKPDGIFEDMTTDRWNLSIDAFDGLSVLKNLSFVKNSGDFYRGKMTMLKVIKGCLDRTTLILPINVSVNVTYDGYFGNSIFEEAVINTERYYQDSGSVNNNEIMDCEEVLKSLLQIFNATVIQMNGEWWIYRSVDVKDEMTFAHYNAAGIFEENINYQPVRELGSHINNYPIHHINANQEKSISASVQAFRIYYKYGNANMLNSNPYLNHSGTISSVTGWTVNSMSGKVTAKEGGSGIKVFSGGLVEGNLISLNENIEILLDDSVDILVKMNYLSFLSASVQRIKFYISTDNYYLIDGQGWVLKSSMSEKESGIIQFANNMGGMDWSTTTPPAPEESNLYFRIEVRIYPHIFPFEINSIEIKPSNTNIKGQYYTAQRNSRISTVTKENVTVYNGDSASDLFVGTIYKSDGETGTQYWRREGRDESKELLEINAEDNLSISPRPMIIYKGDTYGYFPYLSKFLIDNMPGKYLPVQYSFDTNRNINRFSAKEYEDEPLSLTELRGGKVDIEPDFGNETRVTIKS